MKTISFGDDFTFGKCSESTLKAIVERAEDGEYYVAADELAGYRAGFNAAKKMYSKDTDSAGTIDFVETLLSKAEKQMASLRPEAA